MTAMIHELNESYVIALAETTELVRGADHRLLERIAPLLLQQSVALDLRSVQRIDAAGIAALIKLYSCARNAGHLFSVCNVPERVAEILTLVGLAPILVSHDVDQSSHRDGSFERPAA